jgi:Reverse transcriptase (RNA-dependent DNA polymerase)
VNTVAENRSNYTNRDYQRALLARTIQQKIGRPSTRTFISIVENNLLPNCPITRDDIVAAEKILGPDVGSLKGKTVRKGSVRVEGSMINIPASIFEQYRDVVLAGDIMFVSKMPFFMSISRKIKFGTAELLPNQQSKSLMIAIKNVKNVYMKRGFNISIILMDGQFESLRGDLSEMKITLNTVSNDEHVPEIERHIRTIKERVRCIYNMLPFKKMPNRMIVEMIKYSNFWWNSFPPSDSISTTMSPRAIVVGASIDYAKHCQLEFGSYVQTHEEHDNSMATRTIGAIALRPSGNEQGSYYFFSLSTGRVLNRNHWTELPMPAEVIDRIHALARRNNVNNQALEFGDRNGYPVNAENEEEVGDDDDDDESYAPSNHQLDDDTEDSDHISQAAMNYNTDGPDIPQADVYDVPIAGVDNEEEMNENPNNYDDANVNIIEQNNENNEDMEYENEVEFLGNGNGEGINEMNTIEIEDDLEIEHDSNGINNDVDGNANDVQINDMDNRYGARTDAYSLRPRRPRDYSHLHTTLESTVMTQYNMKKGIKMFGEAGTDAVLKELKQLHDKNTFQPKMPSTLTAAEKSAALQCLMFLKEKRNGSIKGRGCADGRKQRLYTAKEDASSPTVAIESVMLSCVVDAAEGRDVATVDIPGAFLHADMEDVVHMKLEGTMAEIMVRINPAMYKKYTHIVNGKQVLYVELKKALYGTLKAALLFWKRLTKELHDLGFETNPYDVCVMNKMINGKQCTVLWHVDDLKISHVDAQVVTGVIQSIDSIFGSADAPLTQTRGTIHEYLGMTIDFSRSGKVKFTMSDYIQEMLSTLPEEMNGESATPAANHLFEVHPKSSEMKLDKVTSDMFHHNVAKLLFLCKRARPDIQTAVAFLCTRVKEPDNDDYKKLTRVMKYLRATIAMPLTLEAHDVQVIKWWVDASFAVHPDMKSHTGGAMSLGKGTIYGTSTRQKLNTKSSTEAELVGVNDVMPQILWTQYFLEAQGYGVEDSIIYQDNQSSILLEKNGRASSGKRTRHINIRYFFVTDRIKAKEVSIQYCPTGDMISDFFTKPLQGAPFKKLRNQIMNVEPSDPVREVYQDHRSVLGQDGNVVIEAESGPDCVNEGEKSVLDGKDCTGLNDGFVLVTYRHGRLVPGMKVQKAPTKENKAHKGKLIEKS